MYTICMQRRLHAWKCGSVCRDAPPSSAAAGAVFVCGCHYCSEDRICTASLCPSCWCRRLRLKKDESTGLASKMLSAQSSMRCSASVLVAARKGGLTAAEVGGLIPCGGPQLTMDTLSCKNGMHAYCCIVCVDRVALLGNRASDGRCIDSASAQCSTTARNSAPAPPSWSGGCARRAWKI